MPILAIHLSNFASYLEVRGISRNTLNETDLAIPPTFGQNDFIPSEQYLEVIKLADEILKDDLLGIRAGEFLNLRSLGLVYQISLSVTSVKEALYYLKDFMTATFPIATVHFFASDRSTEIETRISGVEPRLEKIILENLLTVISRELKMMTRDNETEIFSPYHDHRYPASWGKSDRFFVRFQNHFLESKIQLHRSAQLEFLIPQYLFLIEQSKKAESFQSKVRITILSLAKPAFPELELVSDALNLTPRTLQRKLASENTSFRNVKKELQKTVARLLLDHKEFSVNDITYFLNFSEPAAFIHASKKWFGKTPEKLRNENKRM